VAGRQRRCNCNRVKRISPTNDSERLCYTWLLLQRDGIPSGISPPLSLKCANRSRSMPCHSRMRSVHSPSAVSAELRFVSLQALGDEPPPFGTRLTPHECNQAGAVE